MRESETIVTPMEERRQGADRVLHGLLRAVTSRRKFTAAELRSVLDETFQRLLSSLSAEVLISYDLGADGVIHIHDVHYSKVLGVEDSSARRNSALLATEIQALSLRVGEGIVGGVVEKREPSIRKKPLAGADFDGDLATQAGFEIRSLMTLPLLRGTEAIGAIQVLNKCGEFVLADHDFEAEDLELAADVVRYAARVLARETGPDREFTPREIAFFVARLGRHEYLEIPDGWQPEEKLLVTIGEEALRKFLILPLEKTSSRGLKVAMSTPFDIQTRDSFHAQTGLLIEDVVVSAECDIARVIDSVFKRETEGISTEEATRLLAQSLAGTPVEQVDLGASEDEDSDGIIQLANRIIEDAYARGGSDIHIEPFEKETKVRFRVDGYLKEVMAFPTVANRALVSRLKIMTRSMDITENRLPQDGRIKFKEFTRTGLDIDLRVSTAPVAFGQKVCMRILDKTNATLGLDRMGFSEKNLRLYRDLIQKPYGMVLHVGPTGSGKTTTLYSALSEINKPDVNIQTAEDPIEYMLPNVNQMQMHKEIGLTFAAALRCFLRQDPDVILVGEIRDAETAGIAVEAALTGHLIFSTLHTNDAPGTVVRLVDMGVEPFLISSSLLIVCAQRLMRRLCPKCRTECMPSAYECLAMGVDVPIRVFRPKEGGCLHCKGAGYKGRVGVHELMTLSDEMKDLISKAAPAEELREAAITNGMVPLYDDAMEKVLLGVTSLEEALSTVRKE